MKRYARLFGPIATISSGRGACIMNGAKFMFVTLLVIDGSESSEPDMYCDSMADGM